MNISIEEKKAEAINRMKVLGIFPETIKQFEREGKISRSDPPVGAYYLVEGEELEAVRKFEQEHNCLVYTVVRSYTSIGMMDSYLFVGDDREEWNWIITISRRDIPLPIRSTTMLPIALNLERLDLN